jgi:hypothetical protein
MGYYTAIYVNLRVKEDKLEEFKKSLKGLIDANDNESWFGYYEDISIDDDRCIQFEDYNRKLYEYEGLCEWLSEFVEDGYIECSGEEHPDLWKMEFDGCGGWNDMESVIVYVPQNTLWKELTVGNINGSPTVTSIILREEESVVNIID